MRKIFLAVLFAAATSLAAGAAEPFTVTCGPWIQNVTEDSFTVLWTTAESTFSWIEADGKSWYETVTGRRTYGKFHSVTVSGLEKGKSYSYSIRGKEVLDDSDAYHTEYGPEGYAGTPHSVKTFDYGAPSCRFSVVNDMHFDADKYKILMDGADRDKMDFIALNGDIVSYSNSLDTLLKYTFDPISDLCGEFPAVFARGNHETRGSQWHLLPQAFPTPTGEFYYFFRQGPVAFLVLDAGEDKKDSDKEYSGQADFDSYREKELEWLSGVVKNPLFADAPQKICLMHIPVLDAPDAWYSQHWVAQNFTPVLNAAGVDLMISAHHHAYIVAEPGIYGNDFPIVVNSENDRMDVEVTGNRISLKVYGVGGNLLHSLEY